MTHDGYARVFRFAKARDAIRIQRGAGLPFPWTDDPILRDTRFCNVRREDDRVTRWIAEYWRNDDEHNWFAMAVARLAVNRIATMRDIGYPVPWNRGQFLDAIQSRLDRGLPVYGQAYMIIPPNYQGLKSVGLADRLLDPLWHNREFLAPRKGDTLAAFFQRLTSMNGVGSFTAGQVVADVKHTAALSEAPDWWEWASPGPGSRRGLNRALGRDPDSSWSKGHWERALVSLVRYFEDHGMKLHAQDVQNCLCEFDKYERVRLGQGAAKQRYTPGMMKDC